MAKKRFPKKLKPINFEKLFECPEYREEFKKSAMQMATHHCPSGCGTFSVIGHNWLGNIPKCGECGLTMIKT